MEAGPSRSPSPALEPVDAKADARARRIAAAVQRSRTEYGPEHAYTERGWHLSADLSGPTKKDKQRVEYAATSRLAFPSSEADARQALDDILSNGAPHRDLIGPAARAAIAAGDKDAAASVARAEPGAWKANVGLAVVCSEALAFAGFPAESTHPLLAASAVAMHYPVLSALSTRLDALAQGELSDAQATALGAFAEVVHALAQSRKWAFDRPLFGSEPARPGPVTGAEEMRGALAGIDRGVLGGVLGAEGRVLDAVMARFARAVGQGGAGADEEVERVERGVREL